MNNEFQWRSEMRKLDGPEEPTQDLWPHIHARIQAAPRQRTRWPRLAAAAAVLAMAGGTGVLAWYQHNAELAQQQEATSTPLEWAQPENPKLLAAAQDLDSASASLQQALEQHPDAVFLVGLLNRTNSQRMRLMRAPYAG